MSGVRIKGKCQIHRKRFWIHSSLGKPRKRQANSPIFFLFQGKKQQAKSETVVDHGQATSQQPEEVKVSSSYSRAGQVGLADRTGEQLQLPASQVDRADVTLAGLTGCRVEIAGCPSTLHISNIKLVSLEPMLNSKINVIFEFFYMCWLLGAKTLSIKKITNRFSNLKEK